MESIPSPTRADLREGRAQGTVLERAERPARLHGCLDVAADDGALQNGAPVSDLRSPEACKNADSLGQSAGAGARGSQAVALAPRLTTPPGQGRTRRPSRAGAGAVAGRRGASSRSSPRAKRHWRGRRRPEAVPSSGGAGLGTRAP